MRFKHTVSVLIALSTLAACTKSSESAKPAASREVHLASWANYLAPEAQEQFEKETGFKLQISTYSSNEELLAKVQAGASGIDIAIPSDYMVAIMQKLNLLEALDKSKIPNSAGLDPAYLKQSYDPENRFSLPYAWTTTGLVVNRDLFKGRLKGWKDFFNTPELAGKVSMLDDVREVFGAALKLNGGSVNSVDEAELKKAQGVLKAFRPRIKMFRSDASDLLVNKEVAAAQVYSTDAFKAMRTSHGEFEYILPEEGGTRAIDNLVILKNAKNVEGAFALINFLEKPAIDASLVAKIEAGPVVKAVRGLLPESVKKNTGLFPEPAQLSKLEAIHDVGQATQMYDRLWTELKSE